MEGISRRISKVSGRRDQPSSKQSFLVEEVDRRTKVSNEKDRSSNKQGF